MQILLVRRGNSMPSDEPAPLYESRSLYPNLAGSTSSIPLFKPDFQRSPAHNFVFFIFAERRQMKID